MIKYLGFFTLLINLNTLSAPKISYAILTHNETFFIENLINHILKYKAPEDEIVILDDFSDNEETISLLNGFIKKGVKVCHRGLNYNFAEQRNALNSYCSGEYIFSLDPDEIPHENLIKELHNIVKTNFDCYLVARAIIIDDLPEESKIYCNEKGYYGWPAYHTKIFKNSPSILWVNEVHETIIGFKSKQLLPASENYALREYKPFSKMINTDKHYTEVFRRSLYTAIKEKNLKKIKNILTFRFACLYFLMLPGVQYEIRKLCTDPEDFNNRLKNMLARLDNSEKSVDSLLLKLNMGKL